MQLGAVVCSDLDFGYWDPPLYPTNSAPTSLSLLGKLDLVRQHYAGPFLHICQLLCSHSPSPLLGDSPIPPCVLLLLRSETSRSSSFDLISCFRMVKFRFGGLKRQDRQTI